MKQPLYFVRDKKKISIERLLFFIYLMAGSLKLRFLAWGPEFYFNSNTDVLMSVEFQ